MICVRFYGDEFGIKSSRRDSLILRRFISFMETLSVLRATEARVGRSLMETIRKL